MFLSDGYSSCLFLRKVHSGVNSEECLFSACKIKLFVFFKKLWYIQLYEGNENSDLDYRVNIS